MQRRWIRGWSAGALLFVAGVAAWIGHHAEADSSVGPLDPRGGFGKAVAGTWLVYWDIPEGPSGISILTVNADGQFAGSNSHQHELIADATTEEHGTWVQDGPRSMRTTSVKFSFADQGDGTRALDWIIRVWHRMEMDAWFDASTGTAELDYFLPTADLTVDDPVFTVPGVTVESTRVAVVE